MYRMAPTVESAVEGTVLCDINLFSRLSLLSERSIWYEQVPDTLRDRYDAMYDECARIIGKNMMVANSVKSINVFNNINNNEQSSPPPHVSLARENSGPGKEILYETFLEIPTKLSSMNGNLPSYKALEREIKNTFARLSCDSQLVKFLMCRSIDDEVYKSLYILVSMLSILYDYSPCMIAYGANLILRCNTEREAFAVFCLLMEQRNLRILFLVNPDCMVRYHREFDRHLRLHLPRVWNHFRNVNNDYPITIDITLKWFQSCFLESNPGILSLCVIDMLALGVRDALLRVSLGIMAYLERHVLLLSHSSMDIQNCFRTKTMAIKTTDILTCMYT